MFLRDRTTNSPPLPLSPLPTPGHGILQVDLIQLWLHVLDPFTLPSLAMQTATPNNTISGISSTTYTCTCTKINSLHLYYQTTSYANQYEWASDNSCPS